MLLERLTALDGVLVKYSSELGDDLVAYRNHAYRVANLCVALRPANDAGVEKFALAAAFHDLGIWTARTFDYLAPSTELACDHARCNGHGDWQEDLAGMIHEHHKVRSYRGTGADVVEPFRRADWIDVSRGLLSFGLPRSLLREIFSKWPNAGFHKRLVQLTLREARMHPLRPIPVIKW